ncbi:MAG: ATP-grasp domain-containing protein [Candidatus Methylacidiphilales bacterium]|nr:ATP-grasp domain-containing protein [Candidatus Methylacidiphilales bacterium]
MKVYVQAKRGEHARPFSINAYQCMEGFVRMGCDTVFFYTRNMEEMSFSKATPVIGSVTTYAHVFTALNVDWERPSYSENLLAWLGRDIGRITLAELPALLKMRNVFIKPAVDDKAFTGFVCTQEEDRWRPELATLPPETELIWADPVNFQAEYRVYVLNGLIQNVARYRGLVDVQPNMRVVRDMMAAFTDAPIAYAMDVGILPNGSTTLVEVNEPFAMTNYGLPAELHARMLASRWFQMMGNDAAMAKYAETRDSPPCTQTR